MGLAEMSAQAHLSVLQVIHGHLRSANDRGEHRTSRSSTGVAGRPNPSPSACMWRLV